MTDHIKAAASAAAISKRSYLWHTLKLNNAEDGIEAAQGFIISCTISTVDTETWITFDKTFTEIKAAMDAGIMPVVYIPADDEQPATYYTIIQAQFSPSKELHLDSQGVLVARDEGENDIPVIALD